MQKENLLYEGKTKEVYATEGPAYYVVDYRDDATAFNGLKRGTTVGEGVVSNHISSFMFRMLEKDGIPTHSVKELSDREVLVKKVGTVPLEVIIRNKAAGSLAERLGLKEGTPMRIPALEFYHKNDKLGNPIVNEYRTPTVDFATREEIDVVSKVALRINELVYKFSRLVNIELVDFRLEFDRCDSKIILADEISPDTCRFWDIYAHEKLDKDRPRRDLSGVGEAYAKVMKRIGL